MRRKTRLKVMYWPIFASTCIILIFIGFGPLTSALRPAFIAAWAGGDFGTKVDRWLPGSDLETRSAAFPWVGLAAPNPPKSESRDIRRPASVPRTLLVQNQVNGLPATANVVVLRAIGNEKPTEQRPEEIAATMAWLCSSEAGAVNGQRIPLIGRA